MRLVQVWFSSLLFSYQHLSQTAMAWSGVCFHIISTTLHAGSPPSPFPLPPSPSTTTATTTLEPEQVWNCTVSYFFSWALSSLRTGLGHTKIIVCFQFSQWICLCCVTTYIALIWHSHAPTTILDPCITGQSPSVHSFPMTIPASFPTMPSHIICPLPFAL